MKSFANLYAALDETTKTTVKVAALARYFESAAPADAAWAVFFLTGRKPRQVVPSRKLVTWAAQVASLTPWLFEECYHAVGDMAETIALVLPEPEHSSDEPLARWVEDRLLPLRGMAEDEQRAAVLQAWGELDTRQRFVWNKLITGSFRVGVSQQLVTRALAMASGLDAAAVAHRLMGEWSPTPAFYESLRALDSTDADASKPYPFFLAHPLDGEPAQLGPIDEWQVEWKWDGIRAQLVRRAGQTFLWSRGEELVTERYPEIAAAAADLPDGTVIDGEILPWREGAVLPFGELQRRIGRKTVGKKLLAEVPVILMAYDLIELGGIDLRPRAMSERRALLEQLAPGKPGAISLARHRRGVVGRTGATAGREPRAPRRGHDAEAALVAVPRRPGARRLVEVEGRAVRHRRGFDLCPARQRQAREPVHGLHLRPLE